MKDGVLDKLVLIVFGWLLGLLSPVIVDTIKTRRENKLGRVAIRSELRDVAHKIALAAHAIHMRNGTVNRAHLEWLKGHLERYPVLSSLESLMEYLRCQLAFTDEQLIEHVRQTAEEPGKSLVLQKYPVPILDTRVSALWTFDTTVQRRLLDLRARLELLDDLVDRSRKYSDMTFTRLEGGNHDRVIENMEQTYVEYAKSAKRIVDLVEQLEGVL